MLAVGLSKVKWPNVVVKAKNLTQAHPCDYWSWAGQRQIWLIHISVAFRGLAQCMAHGRSSKGSF